MKLKEIEKKFAKIFGMLVAARKNVLPKIMDDGFPAEQEKYFACIGYWLALLIALASLAIYLFFGYEAGADVLKSYAYLAQEFRHGNWEHFLNPNLPLLLPFCAGGLCSIFPLEPVFACVLVAGCCYIATIPFLYRLLKSLLGDKFRSSLGVLLFACAPQLMRFSCAGWVETGRTFFIVAIIALTLEYAGQMRWRIAVALGVLYGCLCLVRGEGIFFAFLLGGWGIVLHIQRTSFQKRGIGALLGIALVAIVCLIILLPRAWINYRQAGIFLPDQRIARIFSKIFGISPESGGSVGLTHDYFTFPLSSVIGDFIDGTELGYLLLGVVGIFYLIVSKRWRAEYYYFLLLVMLNFFGCLNTVSQHRYFTLNVPLLMPFIVSGVDFIFRLLRRPAALRRWTTPLFYVILALTVCFEFVKGISYATRGFPLAREIGNYLKTHAEELWETPERPTIYSGAFAATAYSDYKVANRYLVDLGDLDVSDAFDGAVFWAGNHKGPLKRTPREDTIRLRTDFELIPHAYSRYITIYRKKKQ